MATKKFHLGDILSITTSKLVSPRCMDGVRDILNFMTGDSLLQHQFKRASDECEPFLLEQFPQLKGIDFSDITPENWRSRLNEEVARFGEELIVHDLPPGRYKFRDPVEELVNMRGAGKVIVVDIN